MHRRMAAVLSLAVLLTACSDDPIGPTGDPLSQIEAEALAMFLADQGMTGTDDGLSTAQSGIGVQSVPTTINVQHSSTHPCPSGGQVGLSFDLTLVVDDETQSFSYDAEGSMAHDACAFPRGDVTFTVDSELNYEAHAVAVNGQPSEPWSAALRGGFSWSATDGRSGTCPITFVTWTDFAAGTRTVQGNVCGHSVNQTVTWTQG